MAVITYLDAISQGLRDEMRRDENVIVLGEDIAVFGGAFKVTRGFLEEFGADRVIDTPISESGFTGAACGAAVEGLRPVVEFQFADFIACAFDQIVNYAAKNYYRWGIPMPVVFRGPSGGGFRGGPYHSQNPEAWFTHVPGLKVVQPATPYDAKGLLVAAIRDNNPVIYLEHKHLYRRIKEEVPEDDYVVPIGVAEVKREGSDLTIVTYGAMVHESLAVAERLSREGAECEVVDLRSLSPLDRDAFLTSVRKTGRALVVHEAHLTGGFGGEVAAIIAEQAFDALDAPVTRVAALDVPSPFAAQLEDAMLPTEEKIYTAARDVLEY
ncbi:MAG: alpha-ketoacid dehydrogenase subunit beta [Vicinamibacterales bacterium]|jgi:2-oxoisovalerate dehydrogenase E1 component beta subunit|nr:alpha-ketoacid dehydrogenase subunit beta [Acidobacteriota bacterium]MDP7473065.1 alpha-ketoacid dehydrogenase subunit beta [Vicinamibacterales bacterium]MDP7670900.1 alpha-ketoacid dehydrogenase subunit beta [Vicinamibacterales bacterium]HJO39645.1 alpha-ketoacid dehydrogenase subunit beta [Vicinamibacterales bacterium]|tara:strand:- start:2177 stop:3151 length:975 start_codon:yes stop_codon:yes gene_type:complete